MSYADLQEQLAWGRVYAAMASAGVHTALESDCRRPKLAQQFGRSLAAFCFAVHRDLIDPRHAKSLLLRSEDQAYQAQVTGLEMLVTTMATAPHARGAAIRQMRRKYPRERPIPFIPEAALPAGEGHFNAGSSFWGPLMTALRDLEPCYCDAPGRSRDKPRAHQQHSDLLAA